MIFYIMMLLTAVFSIGIVGAAYERGFLNGAYRRAFTGGTVFFTSNNYLVQYTQFDTFLTACYNGTLGFIGFAFIGSLFLLILTYVNNFIKFRKAIV